VATRVEQKETRQRQILETALDLFIRKGYAATTIAAIAEAAGMSKGLTFNYFPTKEILYQTLVRQGIETAKAAFELPAEEPFAFFSALTEAILKGIRENRKTAEMFVLLGEAVREEGAPGAEAREARRENLRKTALLIEDGQHRETIRPGNPSALAATYWATIQGICELSIHDPEFPYPEPEWILAALKKERKP